MKLIDGNHSLVENNPVVLIKNDNINFEGAKAMYLSETYKRTARRNKYFLILMLLIGLIISTGNSILAVPADTIEVIAKHPESGESSIYQINFVVSKPIPPKALIQVTFPNGFDLSNLMIAGSTTINGGFELKVNKQVVTMKRSGLGREVHANERGDVKFAIVQNPNQPADNYKIVIEILDNEEKSILRKETLQKIIPAKE